MYETSFKNKFSILTSHEWMNFLHWQIIIQYQISCVNITWMNFVYWQILNGISKSIKYNTKIQHYRFSTLHTITPICFEVLNTSIYTTKNITSFQHYMFEQYNKINHWRDNKVLWLSDWCCVQCACLSMTLSSYWSHSREYVFPISLWPSSASAPFFSGCPLPFARLLPLWTQEQYSKLKKLKL